jgi:hypothetical protein
VRTTTTRRPQHQGPAPGAGHRRLSYMGSSATIINCPHGEQSWAVSRRRDQPAPRPRLPCSTMGPRCVCVRVSEPPPGGTNLLSGCGGSRCCAARSRRTARMPVRIPSGAGDGGAVRAVQPVVAVVVHAQPALDRLGAGDQFRGSRWRRTSAANLGTPVRSSRTRMSGTVSGTRR